MNPKTETIFKKKDSKRTFGAYKFERHESKQVITVESLSKEQRENLPQDN